MRITEQPSDIQLSLPRFCCDGILSENIMPPLPRKHHIWIFSGRPGSGKSSLALSLLTARGNKKQYRRVFDHIYVIVPTASLHSLKHNPFKKHPEDKMFHSLSQDTLEFVLDCLQENAAANENSLLFVDDMASDLKRTDTLRLWNHICANKRHYRTSIWMLVQGIRFLPKSFRRLIDYICLWKFNHTDENRFINEEFSPYPRKTMEGVFRYSFQKKHDFLFMDLANQNLYRNFNKLIISDSSNAAQTKTKKGKEKNSPNRSGPNQ